MLNPPLPRGLVDVKVAVGGIFFVNTGPSQEVHDAVRPLHVGIQNGNLSEEKSNTSKERK